ncbi:MAG TPA: M20 family metallopeptidase [Caldilineaceae bacterium]|nr:M20 family metallopeptidase [Caldilineaceae bacterium]
MYSERLVGFYQTKREEILATIRLLVENETPSDDKARLDAFAELLAKRYTKVGFHVDVIPNPDAGNHLRAVFANPAYVADPTIKPALILCHFDTVWPVGSLATHPYRIDEQGWAYGPGIFDMQSSLALVEYVIAGVQEMGLRLPRPVVLLATSDEETGSHTSQRLIEYEARQSAYVLVMESPLPGGVIKTARKGTGHFEVEITGRAAHAGVEPEKGISAIQELAHQILALHKLTDMQAGTTVNVGVVSGGTRSNVVAPHAKAIIDVRAWTAGEMDRVRHAIRGLTPVLAGAKITTHDGGGRPPLERKVTAELFHQAQTIGAKVGLDLKEGATGGGSDGNLTGALGIPTLDGLGVPGHGAHADHEHIEVDQIAGRLALLTGLLMELRA